MRPLGRRAWLEAAGLLGLRAGRFLPALLAGSAPGCARKREPLRVFLALDPAPGHGIARAHQAGLAILLKDHLEALGGCTVLPWVEPGDPGLRGHACAHLKVRAALEGGQLALGLEGPGTGGKAPVQRNERPGPPRAAFNNFLEDLPFRVPPALAGRLCPEAASALPDLLECMAQLDGPFLDDAILAQVEGILQKAPDCATVHFLLGSLRYNQLVLHPLNQDSQLRAFSAFRAGLDSVPHHPRGIAAFIRLLSDAGLHREALELVASARAVHPMVPALCGAIVYAARTSGLLGLARRALSEMERLSLGRTGLITENTYLYLGEEPAFRGTCTLAGNGRDVRVHFYLGYLALAKGDRVQASLAFNTALSIPGGWYGFEDLCRLYLHAIENRTEEAAALLTDMAAKRAALRAPDGEFTFKLAEAAAFLGNRHRAVELGELAFTQGFGCTHWYETSPLFAPARQTARWEALRQHLLDRQRLLEPRFSMKRFNL